MCGIAGICRADGGNLPQGAIEALGSMTDQMVHRGPDEGNEWNEGPICLGHRRLSIIDIAGGSQPMPGSAGQTHLVFNGEIYNFPDLRSELAKHGAIFRTSSDTEVILAAYDRWGVDCLDRLEGMFAFALWDSRKNILFCARDRFGEKPFYYSFQNGLFAFSSELSPLVSLEKTLPGQGMEFRLDISAICRYLAYEYTPTPQTMYVQAHSLEPAHFLILEKGEITIKRYWDLPAPQKSVAGNELELCLELEQLLNRAVSQRMISDVPLGVFLSGGIDSSIVASIMARHSSTPVKTFSIGFREASYDESAYARIVARAINSDHHERVLSADECANVLPAIVSRMDTPMADASCAPTWLLSELTRQKVTVALGGDGADEFWAGYENYIAFKIALWYNRLPKWIRKDLIGTLVKLLPSSAGYVNPKLAVQTFLKGAAAPDWLRVQALLTAIDPPMQREILDQSWLEKNDLVEFLLPENLFAPTHYQYEHWLPSSKASPLARAFHVYARQFMLDDILVKIDRCSMLHSLEVRSPFLDRKVAEFAARLPLELKLRGFKRKYLLKKAFSGILPPEILKRNKRGFQIPVAQWLRENLKPLLQDMLAPKRLKNQGIFNPAATNRLMEAHFSGKADLRKPLWTLLVLQLWFESNKPAF